MNTAPASPPTPPPAPRPRPVSIALIGNPNTGKSTLFAAIAGVAQRTGNYPGVTVEKKVGKASHDGRDWSLIDLPGTYSLAPRSPDEMVAVDVLGGGLEDVEAPDAVLCVVDAGNLERNLYLVSQVLALGRPTVLALTMVDSAERRGIKVDVDRLRSALGVPVVAVQAHKKLGLDRLREAIASAVDRDPAAVEDVFPPAFRGEVDAIADAWDGPAPSRFLVERLLLDSGGTVEARLLASSLPGTADRVIAARARLAGAGCPVPAVEAMARYGWVARVLDGVVTRPTSREITAADRLDRVLTHRFWGTAIFVGLMLLVFQVIFKWSEVPMDAIDAVIGRVGSFVESRMGEGPFRSLLVDGVIGGVGSVLVFLPQIFALFFFIAILEDCGYMARAAYLMDRLMVRLGLSGKSFIPLLSSFACAIPGVMATRVIENRRDRLTTILVAPLMSCSARLPVYTLLIASFIPARSFLGGLVGLRALTMLGLYGIGVVTAAGVAWLLKRTLLRGETPPFVMELPPYKVPSAKLVGRRVLDAGGDFLRRAGTIILAVAILVWAAAYYPRDRAAVEGPFAAEKARLEADRGTLPAGDPGLAAIEGRLAAIDHEVAGSYARRSYLGRTGRLIEPLVRPLGWDWRIGCAALASFPAREVVVATLGVIFDLGGDVAPKEGEADGGVTLADTLRSATWEGTDRPLFNVPVALSLMVFFALCAQCAATLAVIRRETGSLGWPIFTFAYMTGLAYLAALVTYQVGIRLVA